MSLDLQSLRTAKAALDEGLLTSEDYASVKQSFVQAQSIKSGVEAGFISESDYAEARKAFFSGLGMMGATTQPAGPVATPPVRQAVAVAPVKQATRPVATEEPKMKSPPEPVKTPPARQNATPATSKAPPEPVAQKQPAGSKPPPTVSIPTDVPTPDGDASVLPTPEGVTDRGGQQKVAGQRSMAGIEVHADSVNVVWEINIKKRYRWVSYHIGSGGKQVEIEKVGTPESTWTEFVGALPDDSCRYGVFDYEYTNSEGTKFGKLCFVSWAPDTAPVKMKMQHSSTKDFFRSFLEGLAVELHATDKGDLGEASLRERVKNTVAKK